MKRILIVILVLTLAGVVIADDKPLPERIQERIAKAERQDPEKRGEIYADIAYDYILLASEKFKAGDSDSGTDAVAKAVENAHKATDSATMKHKQIKKTEIRLRQCSTRLEELARTVTFVERDAVKAATKRIDEFRSQLLDAMFKKR
jgi:hypothetical protein